MTKTYKQELFQIGDVAKLFHISVGSLRHYEKIGLVKPELIDENTGYRYYSTRQFECLNTIRYLRVLDMPLPQIADFLKNRNIEKIQEMLCQQKETVIEKQKELKNIEKKIQNRLEQLQDALSSEKESIRVKKISPRRIAWLRHDFSIDSYENPDFETSILQLAQGQKDSIVFLGKVGVGISKEQLLDAIWEEPELVTPNVIEVAINQIRQKMDKPLNIGTIETVRRRGYRFCYPKKPSEG